ncbi:MAG: hypothetical protein IJV00_07525 [Clostridia bacterium]|nr:hypothetical protein [Clostridia bacterium]
MTGFILTCSIEVIFARWVFLLSLCVVGMIAWLCVFYRSVYKSWKEDAPSKEKLQKFNAKQLKRYYKDLKKMWIFFAAATSVILILTAITGVKSSDLYLDMQNRDYITYVGEYKRIRGKYNSGTVIIYDGSGKEIKLDATDRTEEGLYNGTVVYGKRSHAVAQLSGERTGD